MAVSPLTSFPRLTSEEAQQFWYERTNFEHRQAAPNDLKLDRMRRLLSELGDPHQRLRIVHVAGTKGKGSTSAMLASILQQHGYRTGLFTSPHLHAVEERFRVAGQSICQDELTSLLSEIAHACQVVPDATFFEIATAIGFLHFVRRRVDVAVLEVGLGGRFDSTNVCRPEVAVITSISFDHMKQLGNTLASIAFEKSGIVKVGQPTVSGVLAPEARLVIERVCRERRSRLYQLEDSFSFELRAGCVTAETIELPRITVQTRHQRWLDLELPLLGQHQGANAAVSVQTIEVLRERGWPIREEAVRAGLARVNWPGRMEILRRSPLVVVDCAHNVASAEAVVQTLNDSFPPGRRWLLLAVSSDKDVPGIVRTLAPHFTYVVVTRFSVNLRATAPTDLVDLFAQHGVTAKECASLPEAWAWIGERAAPDELICATGSVFLVGELRVLLAENRSTA